jgi:hypothetical protein
MVSEKDLLERMDEINWSGVPDWQHTDPLETYMEPIIHIYRNFLDELETNMSYPLGHLLDVGSGPVSFASIYPDAIALDIDLSYVKVLRERGIKAIWGDMRRMEFDVKSFDTTICLFPPVKTILDAMDEEPMLYGDHLPVSFTWQQRLAQYMFPYARRYVVIHDPTNSDPQFEKYFLDFYKVNDLVKLRLGRSYSFILGINDAH